MVPYKLMAICVDSLGNMDSTTSYNSVDIHGLPGFSQFL
jgi:hypothetical protein